jgi:hypothetical protein
MPDTDTDGPGFSKLVSGPGIAALAVLGVAVLAASRLLGSETILREVITEVIAGFGNAILILALFELFFRAGIERLVRRCERRCRASGRATGEWRPPWARRNWMALRRTSDSSSTGTCPS